MMTDTTPLDLDGIRKEWPRPDEQEEHHVIHELVDEVERLRRGGKELGRIIDRQCRDILDITGLHDMVDETGDGDWGAIWENAHGLRTDRDAAIARAEAAEAEVERLGELVQTQVDQCERHCREAEAKVARVEALADRYDAWDGSRDSEWASSLMQREQLRTALTGTDS